MASPTEITDEVDILNSEENTVAVYQGETYKLDKTIIKDNGESYTIITEEASYKVPVDEDGWLIGSEELPESIKNALINAEKRVGESELTGFPVEFEVEYRTEYNIFRSAWEKEKVRPSSKVGELLEQISVQSVRITIRVSEDGNVTITDLDVWPEDNSVSIELD